MTDYFYEAIWTTIDEKWKEILINCIFIEALKWWDFIRHIYWNRREIKKDKYLFIIIFSYIYIYFFIYFMCYISVDRYELQTTSLHAFFLLTLDLSAYVRQFFWSVCYHYSHIMCMDEKKMMKYDSFILVRYCVACVNVKWWKEKTWECELGGAVTFFFAIWYLMYTIHLSTF